MQEQFLYTHYLLGIIPNENIKFFKINKNEKSRFNTLLIIMSFTILAAFFLVYVLRKVGAPVQVSDAMIPAWFMILNTAILLYNLKNIKKENINSKKIGKIEKLPFLNIFVFLYFTLSSFIFYRGFSISPILPDALGFIIGIFLLICAFFPLFSLLRETRNYAQQEE